MEDGKFWPFETLPVEERKDQHRLEIEFCESAASSGFRAYTFGVGNFGASADSGRVGEMIHRGPRRYWEIILSEPDAEPVIEFIDGFVNATNAVLAWLNGASRNELRSLITSHLVDRPGERGW